MTAENLKLEIGKALDKTNNLAVLELVNAILGGKQEPSAGRISREQYNREINEAMQQVKEGKCLSHEEVVKRLSKF